MNRAARFVLFVASLALVTAACGSTTNVSTTDDQQPTPLPTQAAVFIPTTAPTLSSSTPQDGDLASDASSTSETAEGTDDVATSEPDPSATPTPAPTAAEEERPTALVTAVPLAIEIPTAEPRPTQAPQPTRVPAPQPPAAGQAPPPQPQAPRPTSPPRTQCPGGQVLTVSGCSCPVGTVSANTGCVRLCNQSDLTITGTCLCTGDLYDNGGQCVKRCNAGEVQDRYGGCRRPGQNDSN